MAAIAEKITRGGYEGSRSEKRWPNVGRKERNLSSVAGALLVLHGLSKRTTGGIVEALIGGSLLYRGGTGFCSIYNALGIDTNRGMEHPGGGIRVQRSIKVNRDPETVYSFWRQLDNLPRFMNHLESVTVLSETRSHWVAKAPAGTSVEWDAEITEDVPGHHIAWRSLPGAMVSNAGAVGFVPADGGRATEIKVSFRYDPPGGALSATLAQIFGEEPSVQVEEDLARFKQVMEAGEIVGQPQAPPRHMTH